MQWNQHTEGEFDRFLSFYKASSLWSRKKKWYFRFFTIFAPSPGPPAAAILDYIVRGCRDKAIFKKNAKKSGVPVLLIRWYDHYNHGDTHAIMKKKINILMPVYNFTINNFTTSFILK